MNPFPAHANLRCRPGDLGKAHQLFGGPLPKWPDELNEVLAE